MKVTVLFVVAAVVCLACGGSAAPLEGKLVLRTLIPGRLFSFGSARVFLTSGGAVPLRFESPVRKDGTFNLGDVPVGVYTLEVRATEFVVEPERLEVRDGGRVKSRSYDERRGTLVLGLQNAAVYFPERPKFDPMMWLKNPMVIMMGVSVVMMFVMPRLQANMDPQDLKELQGSTEIITHDGATIDRDDLIPVWAPPHVSRLRTAH